MKQFIDKLIERLEEYKDSHLIERDSEMLEHCKEKEMDCEGSDCFLCVWDKATDIVNQLAEEYINCSTDTSTNISSGWIPCSERLPEPIDDMLQCVIVTDENDWQGMAYYHPQKGWVFAECHNSDRKIDWTEIIAWQPLPAPYQPEEGRE